MTQPRFHQTLISQSMTPEVELQHKKMAPEFGVKFTPMAPISGAGFLEHVSGL